MSKGKDISGPLKGIRILDLGLAGAGPIGPTLLAELGAEVIKVESPEGGNVLRRLPALINGNSLWFPIEGRHKRSLTVDLHAEQGQKIIKDLVKHCDVVLENFRPGTMERWNLGYEELRALKNDLIMVRVSGFGQEGPYKNRTSYDTMGTAMGGVLHLTGHPDDPPTLIQLALCDYISAAFNALATLIAIHYRNKTGKGQWAEITQYEAIFRLAEWTVAAYDKLGLVRERKGNQHPSIAPQDLFLTKDEKWVAIAAPSNKIFSRLVKAMQKEELLEDQRFSTPAARSNHADEINTIVAQWVKNINLNELVDILVRAEVPVGPLYSVKEIVEDPHYKARESLIKINDPVYGEVIVTNICPRFSKTPVRVQDAGVPLGENNQEILADMLGYSPESIKSLEETGVIAPPIKPSSINQTITKGQLERPTEAYDRLPWLKGNQTDMPLEGLRIIELGSSLAASFSTVLLADFGAEVIKVEEPGIGDDLRHLPPYYQGKSLWWAVEGRNKKSITLDLRKEEGKQILKDLVAISDAVVEGFQAGTLEKWGIDYETLKKSNEKIILLRISGFGQEGPYKNRLSLDPIATAMGGTTFTIGFRDRPPVRPGYAYGDYVPGIFGAIGLLAALYHRDRVDEGQIVELALYEPFLRFYHDHIPYYGKTGEIRERAGNKFYMGAPLGLFATKDNKWLGILTIEDKDFGRVARAMNKEEWIKDPRFATMLSRVENRELLNQLVESWTKSLTREELVKIFVEHQVPMSPIFSIEDIFNDPHYKYRANILEVPDPVLGTVKMQDVVPKLSLTPGKVRATGPELGEHNLEIYRGLLGYSSEKFASLSEGKII
jgi:formyl-CoA transferase